MIRQLYHTLPSLSPAAVCYNPPNQPTPERVLSEVTPMATQIAPPTPSAERNGATLPLEYDPDFLRVAYPPNEEPMADPIRLRDYLIAILVPLVTFFNQLKGPFVFHNIFLYYRDGDDVKAVAPDVMVAFDVDAKRIGDAESYHIWAVGKPPEFVMEIGSRSTYNRDLIEKRDIYAKIGVSQYWLFDPPDGARYNFILKGLRLVNGRYEEIPMIEGPGDAIRGHSEVLGLDICWENGDIYYYDPVSGEYLDNPLKSAAAIAETKAALAETQATLAQTETTLAETETTLAQTETTLAETETTLAQTEAAREQAEADNRRLRAQLANRSDSQ